jgi:DNA-binding MarR family transcriptional regulator
MPDGAAVNAAVNAAADAAAASGADPAVVGNDLRVVLGRIVRRLRQGHEAGEVTLSELSVLARLDRSGGLPPGRLAEQERISPQAAGAILAVLEERGLAVRTPDPRDGRRATLSATGAGRALLAGRRSRNAERMERALRQALTPDEIQQLTRVIPLLDRLAQKL